MSADGIVALGPEAGNTSLRGVRHHRVLAELPEYEVIELRFGPGFEGVDAHVHADHIDSFYVLEGEVEDSSSATNACAPGPGASWQPLRASSTASRMSGARSCVWSTSMCRTWGSPAGFEAEARAPPTAPAAP